MENTFDSLSPDEQAICEKIIATKGENLPEIRKWFAKDMPKNNKLIALKHIKLNLPGHREWQHRLRSAIEGLTKELQTEGVILERNKENQVLMKLDGRSKETVKIPKKNKNNSDFLASIIVGYSNGFVEVELTIIQEGTSSETLHRNMARSLDKGSSVCGTICWLESEDPPPINPVTNITVQYRIENEQLVWIVYPLDISQLAVPCGALPKCRIYGPHISNVKVDDWKASWQHLKLADCLSDSCVQVDQITHQQRDTSEMTIPELTRSEHKHPEELELELNSLFTKYATKGDEQTLSLLNSDPFEQQYLIGVEDSTHLWIGFVPSGEGEYNPEQMKSNCKSMFKMDTFPRLHLEVDITIFTLQSSHPNYWDSEILKVSKLTSQEIRIALILLKGKACWMESEDNDENFYTLLIPASNRLLLDDVDLSSLKASSKDSKIIDRILTLLKSDNLTKYEGPTDTIIPRVVVQVAIRHQITKALFALDTCEIPIRVDGVSRNMSRFCMWLRWKQSLSQDMHEYLTSSCYYRVLILGDQSQKLAVDYALWKACDSDLPPSFHTVHQRGPPPPLQRAYHLGVMVVITVILDDRIAQLKEISKIVQFYQNKANNQSIRLLLLISSQDFIKFDLLWTYVREVQTLVSIEGQVHFDVLLYEPRKEFSSTPPLFQVIHVESVDEEKLIKLYRSKMVEENTEPPTWELVAGLLVKTKSIHRTVEFIRKKHFQPGTLVVIPLYKALCGSGASTALRMIGYELRQSFHVVEPTTCDVSDAELKELVKASGGKKILILLDDLNALDAQRKYAEWCKNNKARMGIVKVINQAAPAGESSVHPFLEVSDLDLFEQLLVKCFPENLKAIRIVIERAKHDTHVLFNRHHYVLTFAATQGQYQPPVQWIDELCEKMANTYALEIAQALAFICAFCTEPLLAENDIEKLVPQDSSEASKAFWSLFKSTASADHKEVFTHTHSFFAQLLLKKFGHLKFNKDDSLCMRSLLDAWNYLIPVLIDNPKITTTIFGEKLLQQMLLKRSAHCLYSKFVNQLLVNPVPVPPSGWPKEGADILARKSYLEDVVSGLKSSKQINHAKLMKACFYCSLASMSKNSKQRQMLAKSAVELVTVVREIDPRLPMAQQLLAIIEANYAKVLEEGKTSLAEYYSNQAVSHLELLWENASKRETTLTYPNIDKPGSASADVKVNLEKNNWWTAFPGGTMLLD